MQISKPGGVSAEKTLSSSCRSNLPYSKSPHSDPWVCSEINDRRDLRLPGSSRWNRNSGYAFSDDYNGLAGVPSVETVPNPWWQA